MWYTSAIVHIWFCKKKKKFFFFMKICEMKSCIHIVILYRCCIRSTIASINAIVYISYGWNIFHNFVASFFFRFWWWWKFITFFFSSSFFFVWLYRCKRWFYGIQLKICVYRNINTLLYNMKSVPKMTYTIHKVILYISLRHLFVRIKNRSKINNKIKKKKSERHGIGLVQRYRCLCKL